MPSDDAWRRKPMTAAQRKELEQKHADLEEASLSLDAWLTRRADELTNQARKTLCGWWQRKALLKLAETYEARAREARGLRELAINVRPSTTARPKDPARSDALWP